MVVEDEIHDVVMVFYEILHENNVKLSQMINESLNFQLDVQIHVDLDEVEDEIQNLVFERYHLKQVFERIQLDEEN